ncbi:hypothetical protein PR003_g9721 [Phytophthora rubi]|uniref:Uncharacterized protein n=1 Tax=Phytophthora rubi TaxID=129364 RepID=A0A6A3NWV4_9STRA|nr:hypothetical protein PR001_g9752 [Phytophthora rubi]KAE9047694.1 hypothetical protein PR002_g903 [Phytophthora rubi]KAE9341948.1 hypothetical protein PR003_g9721 [Phytophthora rubi]
MDEKETGGGDVDALVDLMESELGTSSQKQDVSARSKFNAFLDRHVSVGMTLMKLKAVDVTKVMFGQLLSFLLLDPDVAWQTSMNYASSIKRQLEVATGTKPELEWYKRCRRHLSKRYLQEAISTGKKLKEQAPAMTLDDLRVISKI